MKIEPKKDCYPPVTILAISLYNTTTINNIKSAKPTKLIIPSFSSGRGFRRINSMIYMKSLPPSRAGNGIRFKTPRLALNYMAKFNIFNHT